jgi:DNA anti-recombination protein RmuC
MKNIVAFFSFTLLPIFAYASGIGEIVRDPITVTFVFVITLVTLFLQIKYDRYAINHGPEILTTIGIFGCFTGIAVALLNFDANNINESVPNLLNGVKTAFWASVSGVFGALTIKFRHRFSKDPVQSSSDSEPKSASLEDVVSSINGLRKTIAGDTDTSLISQIKLMRQEQNDNAQTLKKSLDDFAHKVSELGSKALIEALQNVIRDFNTQLNEQFGENFKQLNLAVEKLVVWQQQYKEELDRLQEVQKQSASDLKQSAGAFANLVEKSTAYTSSAEALTGLLTTFENQYAVMKQSQESLAAVLVELKSVEPSFSQKLTDLTQVFKSGTETVSAEVQTQIKKIAEQMQNNNTEFANLITQKLPEIQKILNEQLQNSQNELKKNFTELDKNLEVELQKALTTLGQQLASLSEKFVSDYSPLTDKLREVVNMTKGI